MSLIHSDTSIAVVAVGPGDSSLMTLQGREILENADVVAGFKTVLDVVRPWIVNADARDMTYRDQEEVLEYVESQALLGKKCVVCAWGDLNFSARELVARVRRRAGKVELTPGISSVQVACVRAGIAMEDSLFITLHQRRGASDDFAADVEEVVHFLKDGRRNVIMLPRPYDLMPPGIAKELVAAGIPGDTTITVFQRRSLNGEKRWNGTLEECSAITEELSDLSIMVIYRGGEPGSQG